jgi:FtsH-binding integral membrane protein
MSNWSQQPPGWGNNQQQGSWAPQQSQAAVQQPYGYGYGVPRPMDMSVDAGLRSFMLGIYNYMALGLVVSGVLAWLAFSWSISPTNMGLGRIPGVGFLTPFGQLLYVSPLKWVIVLAPLGMLLAYSFFLANRMGAQGTKIFYFAFTALMGLSLAAVFFRFQLGSIAQVFFMTAAAFGALSLWGYTTKRDLTGMGTFLIMGLIGLLIASIVNIFIASSALQFIITIAGLLIFAGLTAWDTQNLKNSYYDAMDQGEMQKLSVNGALSLYLNFVNIFQLLLSLFGIRNEE